MLAAHFASRGIELERLNLRVPSFEHLRFSTMLATAKAAMGGPADRAVLIGSSLGGLTAAHTAAADARVSALVLLAPAFQLLSRWRQRLGEAGWQDWHTSGWLQTHDHTTGELGRVDVGFVHDLQEQVGSGFPDVRVPTLILHGRGDEAVDIAVVREFARGKRHVHLIELDDGHELIASMPRITAEVDAFLRPFLGWEAGSGSDRPGPDQERS